MAADRKRSWAKARVQLGLPKTELRAAAQAAFAMLGRVQVEQNSRTRPFVPDCVAKLKCTGEESIHGEHI